MLKQGAVILILTVVSFILIGCSFLATSTTNAYPPDKNEGNLVAESYSVYSATLAEYKSSPENGKQVQLIVIREDTGIDEVAADLKKQSLENLNLKVPAEFQSALDDYKTKNTESEKLTKSFNLAQDYVLVSSEEMKAIFQNKNIGDNWQSFYKKYPNSVGVVRFSKVGFDADKTHALVYRELVCGGLCADGSYLLLTKEEGEWKVVKTMNMWVS